MDCDPSAGNIVTDVFPEKSISYCGNHTAETFHQDLVKIKTIQCKVSTPSIGKYSGKYTSLTMAISLQLILLLSHVKLGLVVQWNMYIKYTLGLTKKCPGQFMCLQIIWDQLPSPHLSALINRFNSL